jgi:hypothetical protein
LPPPSESEESYYVEEEDAVSEDNYETRIKAFYLKYDPTRVKNIPALLAKYQGKEPELIAALELKYGPEPNKL